MSIMYLFGSICREDYAPGIQLVPGTLYVLSDPANVIHHNMGTLIST